MNEHQKYLLQEKLMYDKQQYKLSPLGIEENTSHLAVKELNLSNRIVICPFCLSRGMLHNFIIGNKKGMSRRYGKCPECSQGMLLETLLKMLKWTSKEYADFVFNYGFSGRGFWDKCSFQKWKKRLYDLGFGFGSEFWNRYKELKGEYSEEDKY